MSTTLIAGIPSANDTLFHAIRFGAGDPAALIDFGSERLLIIRDIEMDRARKSARVDRVACPADFAPEGGLSGDRETATAQAAAEAIRRSDIAEVTADRTLPLSFLAALRDSGIKTMYDQDLGVTSRRSKDAEELDALRTAQADTQTAIATACETIAAASPDAQGLLMRDGDVLTAERVRTLIDICLLERGYENPTCIVAGGPQGADCHNHGHGALRTSEPIIIDVFPRSKSTRYNGDCTRMVVHGEVPPAVERMHAAVLAAKIAGENVAKAGITGEAVNAATTAVIVEHGYELGLPEEGADPGRVAMVHGTGHGVGLAVHEPPLLDRGGPPLVAGDVITIEPGLYGPAVGGLRLEDMVVVTEDGCEDLGSGLQLALTWG
ncbi:MAG: aminopeptidase P family protein [Planctomycetes bacterium]|jgi:Xaa-Pro aminopeptidase|nr:aminopeptidase P family protein [Planctomycetota bacterium]MCP4839954.1 aminopeptidase P family protein [Planctomycetota bacterium]